MAGSLRPSRIPLLVVYDDSLDNRWEVAAGSVATDLAVPGGAGRLYSRAPVPCGQSLSAHFSGSGQKLLLSSVRPVAIADNVPLVLSLRVESSSVRSTLPSCSDLVVAERGVCSSEFCVSVRLNTTTSDGQSRFIPLCNAAARNNQTRASRGPGGWARLEAPLEIFGIRAPAKINQLVLASGPRLSEPRTLKLDSIWFGSSRPLRVGDTPPSYGMCDTQVNAPLVGDGSFSVLPHFNGQRAAPSCQYMIPYGGRKRRDAPLCKVDGDHLDGEWVQSCEPSLIDRPDVFAYGSAITEATGDYAYRLCYRQSASERLRVMQALSWSWRPDACTLRPVSGAVFDKWLRGRTLLFLGDSLMAQAYYSLLWLLGDWVVEKSDFSGLAPDDKQRSNTSFGTCKNSVGNEGGTVSIARLRGGGKLIKVLRHEQIFGELKRIDRAFWLPFLQQADVVILNVGHHYHRVDPAFRHYDRLASTALVGLGKFLKPAAELIYRTTNIGHAQCNIATRPLASRIDAWRQLSGENKSIFEWQPPQLRRQVDVFRDKYNWRGPPLFETAWERFAGMTPALAGRFTLLNMSFLDLRADGHVGTSMRFNHHLDAFMQKLARSSDCLHYCFPGPTDFWALTTYNMLVNNPKFAGASST